MGVEGDERAVGEPRERVDLGQGHVVVALQARKAGEHRGRAVELGAGHATTRHRLLCLEIGDRMEVGEMTAPDVVGVLLGNLLDVDPAHVAEQHHRPLGTPVPEHGGVVLLLDLCLRVDQDPDREVTADLELEDRGGVSLGLLGGVGELDAAGLHPTTGEHLRLDHGRSADLGGRSPRLACGRAEAVLGHRDPGALDYSA